MLKKILIGIAIAVPLILIVMVIFINNYHWNAAKPTLERLVARHTPYTVQLNGDIRTHLGTFWDIELQGVRVQSKRYPDNAPPLATAQRFHVKGPVLKFFSSPTLLDVLEVEDATIYLLRDKQDELLFMPKPTETKTSTEPPKLDRMFSLVKDFSLQDVKIIFHDQKTAKSTHLTVENLSGVYKTAEHMLAAHGHGNLEKIPLRLMAEARPEDQKNKDLLHTKMEATAGKNNVSMQGSVTLGREGLEKTLLNVDAKVPDLGAILQHLLPLEIKPVAFTVQAKVNADKKSIAVENLQWNTAKSHATLTGKMLLAEATPRMDANIVASTLFQSDLNSFLPQNKAEKPAAKKSDDYIFSRDPLPLKKMPDLNAAIDFHIQRFYGEGILSALHAVEGKTLVTPEKIQTIIKDLSIADGHIQLENTLHIASAGITANGTAAFQKLALKDLVTPFFADSKLLKNSPKGLFSGNLSGKTHIKTSGNSLHLLAQRLNGGLTLALEDGQLNAALLPLLNFDIPDAAKMWVDNKSGKSMPCLIAQFPIKDGVLRSEAFELTTEGGDEWLGDGYVDLGEEKFDLRVAAKTGDKNISHVQPLHFKGKLNKPSLNVELEKGFWASAQRTIRQYLPHAKQRSVAVQSTSQQKECSKELMNRYLPQEDSTAAH